MPTEQAARNSHLNRGSWCVSWVLLRATQPTTFRRFRTFVRQSARLLTVVSSLKAQERNILDLLAESVSAARSGEIPPSPS
jgi:hypothetical protein